MSTTIRLSRVHFPVTALGPGLRLGVWVQGCTLACPGCMSRDTWDTSAGTDVALDDVVDVWRTARSGGAIGVTLSGGEPAEQPEPAAELVRRIRHAGAAPGGTAPPIDVLVFTGLDEEGFARRAPGLADVVDAVVVGRFDVTQPTDLIWRGSANQRLIPLTPLGAERYTPHLDETTTSPPIQFAVSGDRIWTVGIPRIGDLPALERRLRAQGIESGGVSWRP